MSKNEENINLLNLMLFQKFDQVSFMNVQYDFQFDGIYFIHKMLLSFWTMLPLELVHLRALKHSAYYLRST